LLDGSTGSYGYGLVSPFRLLNVSAVWVRVLWLCVCAMRRLPPCLRPHLVSSQPPRTPRLSPCLHLRPRHACARPFPAGLACGPAFDRRPVADCLHPGAASVGSGPALEHQNRPHPSGGGNDISRPCGSSMPENTRIASGRRRIPPARTWGVSAVFLSNNHGQTIMVGRGSVRVRSLV